MKWLNHPLSGQHFYLKSAVFLTGLAIGLDSSLRQLLIQLVLILTILIFEPKLYLSLLNALKKLLPFFAGYWVFATLFGQEFLSDLLDFLVDYRDFITRIFAFSDILNKHIQSSHV